MAMRLDPVRLLVADDVGIGKTIEASLVARELLDRGEATRLAVLCPPHLAEQWQRELHQKFHIDAELVLSSTVQRLERSCRPGESLFDRYPAVIVSTDFIKSERRRDDFIRACPELVIVDEAHTCTIADKAGRARQARHELVKRISADDNRHLILVTATPHSGNEAAFRSLLGLLRADFGSIPSDLETDERAAIRAQLADHLIQRRRADIRDYLAETSFPDRKDKEDTYALSPEYKAFFQKVFAFAQEMVADKSGSGRHRRVRWWSALALLRSLASSPRAAASTLRNRAATADSETPEDADELGRRAVLDQEDLDTVEGIDFTPGGDAADESADRSLRDRLRSFAREAEKLESKKDEKLNKGIKLVKELLDAGHHPILFCRFVDTAEYLAEHLRAAFKKQGVEVAAVTGMLPPKEREDRIKQLAEHDSRVLVCTDCLSEGINLQDEFDAVMHYDLSWNPTRHEQREGRVDRFGQPRDTVRVLTYFGKDNQIDGVVLDVLLRKHKQIKSDLGISVAVPGNSEDVIEALFEGMLLRESSGIAGPYLPGFEEFFKPQREDLHAKWDDVKDKEKRSRSRFAQLSIKKEEAAAELAAIREAIGAGPTTKNFVEDVLHLAGVPLKQKRSGQIEVTLGKETPRALRNAIGRDEPFVGRFELPVDERIIYLSRTHPIIEGLASYVLETALDEVAAEGERIIAKRCGAIRTDAVREKTSLLLVRFRYHLIVKLRGETGHCMLAEEIRALAFTGTPEQPNWLDEKDADELLQAKPSANVPPSLVTAQVTHLVSHAAPLEPHLAKLAKHRAELLLDAHTRVRKSAKMKGRVAVEPVLPPDLLGCFILLPPAEQEARSHGA
jgi:superfamily II DNA or RNA helicase